MIWESIWAMTIIDLLIIALIGGACVALYRYRKILFRRQTRIGALTIAFGLLVGGAFHLTDLFVMHVLPMLTSMDTAMAFMSSLHLDYKWLIDIVIIGSIVLGFVLLMFDVGALVTLLEQSESKLTTELDARKEAENAWQESRNLLRLVIDTIPATINLKDRDGRIILGNSYLARVYGLSVEQMEGRTATDIPLRNNYDDSQSQEQDRIVFDTGQPLTWVEEDFEVEDRTETWLLTKAPIKDEQGKTTLVLTVAFDISDRKLAEQALGASEARYREIFDESPVGIWEDDWSDVKRMIDDLAAGGVTDLRRYFDDNPDKLRGAYNHIKVVDISRVTYEMFGAPSKQAMIDINRAELETIDILNGFRDSMIAFMAGETSFAFESSDIGFEGAPIVTSYRLVIPPRYSHDWSRVLYSIEDITDRKLTEEALKESERTLAAAQRIAGLGHWLWDELENRIITFSEQLARTFGVEPEDFPRTSEGWFAFVHPDDRERVVAEIERCIANQSGFDIEYRIVRSDGEIRFVRDLSEALFDDGGQFVRTLGTLLDITDHKLAEEDLLGSETRLNQLQVELARAARLGAMGEMASALAHELNQPLTAIMNYLQVGQRALDDAGTASSVRIDDVMAKAIAQADRASAIIRGLRRFIDVGEVERVECDINSLVKEATALGIVGALNDVDLNLELGDRLPSVLVNRIQVQQVVLNLVRNGVEAMIETSERKLIVRTGRDRDGGVEISVRDTGTGIPSPVADRLFEPFVTTKTDGMGIGLSISRSIIEDHGGELWVTPNREGGSTFHFTVAGESQSDDEAAV